MDRLYPARRRAPHPRPQRGIPAGPAGPAWPVPRARSPRAGPPADPVSRGGPAARPAWRPGRPSTSPPAARLPPIPCRNPPGWLVSHGEPQAETQPGQDHRSA